MGRNTNAHSWIFFIIGIALIVLSLGDALNQLFYIANPSPGIDLIEIRLFQSAADTLAGSQFSAVAWLIASTWSISGIAVGISAFRIGLVSNKNAEIFANSTLARLSTLSRIVVLAILVRAICGLTTGWLGRIVDMEVAISIATHDFIWALLISVSIERATHLLRMKSPSSVANH